MKLNVVLPWVLVLGLAAGSGAVYLQSNAKDAELTKLRAQTAEMEQLHVDLAEAQAKSQLPDDQVMVSRKDKEELIRLRGEVSSLREETKQLSKQKETAQLEAQLAKSQTAEALQTAQANSMKLASMQTDVAAKENLNRCINNLRQLDGAKQQWALENNKTATAIPTARDIAPYLKDSALPKCPAGGTYSLNSLQQAPACSIQGHALSQ